MKFIITNIDWDADDDTELPEKVEVVIDDPTDEMLEDIDGYADIISDYLSDKCGYCVRGFAVEADINEY